MNSILAVALIVVFFVVSLIVRKLRDWRGLPYFYGALAVFSLVSALINREFMYPCLLFMIFALGFTIKSIRKKREQGLHNIE